MVTRRLQGCDAPVAFALYSPTALPNKQSGVDTIIQVILILFLFDAINSSCIIGQLKRRSYMDDDHDCKARPLTYRQKNDMLVSKWLSNLLLDEHRELYHNMSKDQKILVLFALKYNSN